MKLDKIKQRLSKVYKITMFINYLFELDYIALFTYLFLLMNIYISVQKTPNIYIYIRLLFYELYIILILINVPTHIQYTDF